MKQQKILIIDDDHDIVDALEIILSMEGYEVDHAYEGKEGVQKAITLTPNLILLDYMLPDLNGKEVSLQMQSIDQLKHIPVILISASREAYTMAQKIKLADFIEKPFEMDMLLRTVKRHIIP